MVIYGSYSLIDGTDISLTYTGLSTSPEDCKEWDRVQSNAIDNLVSVSLYTQM